MLLASLGFISSTDSADFTDFLSHTDLTDLTKRTCYCSCLPSGMLTFGKPTSCEHFLRRRERSVGCDEGRFTFPEELLSKAKSYFVRLPLAPSGGEHVSCNLCEPKSTDLVARAQQVLSAFSALSARD